jgi:hypothetical protein
MGNNDDVLQFLRTTWNAAFLIPDCLANSFPLIINLLANLIFFA